MLFNSFEFLLFFPIVFLIYWELKQFLKVQNIFVIIASYVFYGYWDWKFLILIFITSLCSFLSGIYIDKKNNRIKKIFLWGNVIVNVGILCLFKYYNFFAENISSIFHTLGIELDWVTMNLVLPLGISFYTFQALSYSIEVYRGNISPTKDIFAFFAFISFFPQLTAGPIERANNLLPQFLSKKKFEYDKAVDGCRQFLWGLFKKMVVADNCANGVNYIFEHYDQLGGGTLLLGLFLFAFQIYGDFSGYSDMAIGIGRLFGINLMKNFNFPYFSRNVKEYWRKWHISLMSWFRDYVYIPLGGSRVNKLKKVRNTFVVFLLSGFWHGADWTYILWGGYNAILYLPLLNNNGKNDNYIKKRGMIYSFKECLLMGGTFFLIMIGWIFFRANNIEHAWSYFLRMIANPFFTHEMIGFKGLFGSIALLVFEWVQRHREHVFDFKGRGLLRFKLIRLSLYAVVFAGCIIFAGKQTNFIYFQF